MTCNIRCGSCSSTRPLHATNCRREAAVLLSSRRPRPTPHVPPSVHVIDDSPPRAVPFAWHRQAAKGRGSRILSGPPIGGGGRCLGRSGSCLLLAGLISRGGHPRRRGHGVSLLDHSRRRTRQRNRALAPLASSDQDVFPVLEKILIGRPHGCTGSLTPAVPYGAETHHNPEPHRRGRHEGSAP